MHFRGFLGSMCVWCLMESMLGVRLGSCGLMNAADDFRDDLINLMLSEVRLFASRLHMRDWLN